MSRQTQGGCRQFMSNHEKSSCVHYLISFLINSLINPCDLIEELESYRKDYCLLRLIEN